MLTMTEDKQATVQRFNQDTLMCINNFQAQLTTHSLLLLAFQIFSHRKSPQLHLNMANCQGLMQLEERLRMMQPDFIWINMIWGIFLVYFFGGGGCSMSLGSEILKSLFK